MNRLSFYGQPKFQENPEIVFDASHNQFWSVWDTGVVGYSQLAVLLREAGYRVSENQLPLASILPNLTESAVLVLGAPQYATYSKEEVGAVVAFVKKGGGLLLLGEHEDFFSINTEQNKLGQQFGMRFKSDLINDPLHSIAEIPQWLKVGSEPFGLNDIGLFAAASMELDEQAEVLAVASADASLEPEKDDTIEKALSYVDTLTGDSEGQEKESFVVAARAEFGLGRVITVSDSEFLWNWNDGVGLNYGENVDFSLKVFSWLSDRVVQAPPVRTNFNLLTGDKFNILMDVDGQHEIYTNVTGGKISPTFQDASGGTISWSVELDRDGKVEFYNKGWSHTVYVLKPNNASRDQGKAVFVDSHQSRQVDDSISGLFLLAKTLRDEGYEVVSTTEPIVSDDTKLFIITNPLERFSVREIENLSQAKKILLLGESSTSILSTSLFGSLLRYQGYSHLPKPINFLASEFDVEFSSMMILGDSGSLTAQLNHKLDTTKGSVDLFRASTVSSTHPIGQISVGKATWGEASAFNMRGGGEDNKFESQFDTTLTSAIVWDKKAFAVGDVDPLSNAHIKNNLALVDLISEWIEN
jgi:hypothetical protein